MMRSGPVRLGKVWQGGQITFRRGAVCHGVLGQGGHGAFRLGRTRLGWVRFGKMWRSINS